jgi:hypothetical protein
MPIFWMVYLLVILNERWMFGRKYVGENMEASLRKRNDAIKPFHRQEPAVLVWDPNEVYPYVHAISWSFRWERNVG